MSTGTRARPDAPPPETLRWAERAAGRGYRVVRVRRLTGGVETATHELTLRAASAAPLHLVLRRPHPEAVARDPERVPSTAAAIAHAAAHAPTLPLPDVVAHDRTALLMRKLPGRIDLAPRDPDAWLRQLADGLRSIHEIPPRPGAPVWTEAPPVGDRRPPAWSGHPHLWEQALERVAARPPEPVAGELAFVHGDYQHFNLLWSRGRLSGIVDWSAYDTHQRSRDVGHCRLNLAILYGADVADDFARRYALRIDPWWDLWETVIFLPSWGGTITRQVGNRLDRPVDVDAIHRRVDEHLRRVLQSAIAG